MLIVYKSILCAVCQTPQIYRLYCIVEKIYRQHEGCERNVKTSLVLLLKPTILE